MIHFHCKAISLLGGSWSVNTRKLYLGLLVGTSGGSAPLYDNLVSLISGSCCSIRVGRGLVTDEYFATNIKSRVHHAHWVVPCCHHVGALIRPKCRVWEYKIIWESIFDIAASIVDGYFAHLKLNGDRSICLNSYWVRRGSRTAYEQVESQWKTSSSSF
jgi:hypothetical protein